MKMILEFNPAEALNAITSGALLELMEKAVSEESAVRNVVKKTKEAKEESETETKPTDNPKEPKISAVEIRSKFVALSKKGKKVELKDLLADLGVAKVSDIKPEQYEDAMSKLEAM